MFSESEILSRIKKTVLDNEFIDQIESLIREASSESTSAK